MKQIMVAVACLLASGLFAAEPAKPAAKSGNQSKAVQAGNRATGAKTSKVRAKNPGKMSLSEARERITEIIKNPEKMGEVMSQLSAKDQNTFLAEVNKAIASMPASTEQKTAIALKVNREALLNSQKGNLQPLVATMFSTTKIESLTVMAETYAEDLFNRATDAAQTFTDEQFTEIASSTVKEVAKACDGLSDAAPRDTLAVWLFEKASNGTIATLEDTLLEVAISDSETREVAKGEWLAEAKSSSESGTTQFTSLLASADAGQAPNAEKTMDIAGQQQKEDVLSDLKSDEGTDSSTKETSEDTSSKKNAKDKEDETKKEATDDYQPNQNVDVPIAVDPANSMSAITSDQGQKVVNSQGEQIMPQTKGESTTGRDTAAASSAAQAASTAGETQPKTNADVPYNPTYNREQVEEAKKEYEPEPEPEPEPKPYQYGD